MVLSTLPLLCVPFLCEHSIQTCHSKSSLNLWLDTRENLLTNSSTNRDNNNNNNSDNNKNIKLLSNDKIRSFLVCTVYLLLLYICLNFSLLLLLYLLFSARHAYEYVPYDNNETIRSYSMSKTPKMLFRENCSYRY